MLFVDDDASYMVKSGEVLKEFRPKLIHVMCMTHELHTVAKVIKEKYQNVDQLISYTKKLFLKASSFVNIFKYIPI